MRHFGLLFIITVVFSWVGGTWADMAQSPQLKETPCRFEIPHRQAVTCYDLIVPEDRNQSNSPALRIHVAHFPSDDSTPAAEPIVYLDGGPGASPLATLPEAFEYIYRPFLAHHDLILVDQRGTGYSEPNLACPEYDFTGSIDTISKCWERLQAAGVDLFTYNSATSAADLDDLRRAMGIKQWNVYGSSYGTRLALTLMRDYPDGIRSVVLDGVYPPQVNLYLEFPANVDHAFQSIFDSCAADANCNSAYPDLKSVFLDQIAHLADTPVMLDDGYHGGVRVTAFEFVNAMFGAMYDPYALRLLPRAIYEAQNGNYEPIFELYGLQARPASLSEGLHYSVQCVEELSFTAFEDWQTVMADYEYLAPFMEVNMTFGLPVFRLCETLKRPPVDPIENDPVVSDIPTLVTTGEFDPITPVRWGKLAAQTLSNSYAYTFPALGHAVFNADICPQTMILDFFVDPSHAPEASCIQEMPEVRFRLSR